MKTFTCLVCWFCISSILAAADPAPDISRSFEFRYYSPDPAANGETDFKGDTELFSTDQRIEFLRQYGDYAKQFFHDPDLDTQAASDEQVQLVMSRLKPQPLPSARTRIPLTDWRFLGCKPNQHEQESQTLDLWRQLPGVTIENDHLLFQNSSKLEKSIPLQDWRFSFQAKLTPASSTQPVKLILAGDSDDLIAAEAGFTSEGKLYYSSDGKIHFLDNCSTGQGYEIKFEVDLTEKAYNVFINGDRKAYFVPLANPKTEKVSRLLIHGAPNLILDDLLGYAFHSQTMVEKPYTIALFLVEDFHIRPDVEGWQKTSYDDSLWQTCTLPKVHGSLRCAEEDLYLRTQVKLDDFTRATLSAETLDPEGEIWINGQVVFVSRDRHPIKLDVTPYLQKNQTNLLAVRVKNFINPEQTAGNHAPNDPYIGWFAGRMVLDLTPNDYIDDVFVYTESAETPAKLHAKITLANDGKKDRFQGTLRINLYPWLPEESSRSAASADLPVTVTEWSRLEFDLPFEVLQPLLWTWKTPNLYKVHVQLLNSSGRIIDDEVLTTGIRTVSQQGGAFRINNQPEMLNGAQIMGFRAPLENIALWHRCAPPDWIVREILQIKNMNGNLMRIHVHAWENVPPAHSINDPRLAEIGDQLGIMFIWPTTAWVRTGSPWGVDFDGLPKYIQQVRNHPSIVLWEGSNHPGNESAYERTNNDWFRFMEKIVNTILPVDQSRLIAPMAKVHVSEQTKLRSPIYPHPLVVDGSMDILTGYGRNWQRLRLFPQPTKDEDFDYLAALHSPDRAYFNFEHQESIGQNNWNLTKGKPWHLLHSYEHPYDDATIGRKLSTDEWLQSQAWHAFSAYESIRKMRWLDYDGFSWCSLHSGANNATYMKPLIDYLGFAKLAWYANKMAFQNILAGSDNVDVVYGPADPITPIILNLGPAQTVSLTIEIKDTQGRLIQKKDFPPVDLPPGRTLTRLTSFHPSLSQTGHYAFEYIVRNANP